MTFTFDSGREDLDDMPFKFGKHTGLTANEIAEIDPQYIVWAHRTVSGAPISDVLAQSCEQETRDQDEDSSDHVEVDTFMRNLNNLR